MNPIRSKFQFSNMKILAFIIIIIFTLVSTYTFSQEKIIPCYTDEYNANILNSDPVLKKLVQSRIEFDDHAVYTEIPKRAVRIIPVVFHIIHDHGYENIPDAKVHALLKQVNEDWRLLNSDLSTARSQFAAVASDMQVEFRLARIDPDGNCTNGINRIISGLTVDADDAVKGLIDWDNKKYLNIWVVRNIYSGSSSGGTILGYALMPWTAQYQPTRDGIVMVASTVDYGERTLTHEIGHYLGLSHTFEGGCSSSGSNCNNQGDKVCDTPPESGQHFGCDYAQNSCSAEVPDQLDMIENHMSYSYCRVLFTSGQKSKVDYSMNQYRAALYSEANLRAVGVFDTTNYACIPHSEFSSSIAIGCIGNQVDYINNSLGGSNPTYKWHFEGATPAASTIKNPTVTYSTPGRYLVKLTVTNSMGTDSIIKDNYISIYGTTGTIAPLRQNYEGNNVLDSFGFYDQAVEGVKWAQTTKGFHSGTIGLYLNSNVNVNIGQTFSFILPPVNLNGLNSPVIQFWYAFAKKLSTDKDNLKVYTSVDCGKTWLVLINKNQLSLPTTSVLYPSFEFKPTIPSLWKLVESDISSFKNFPSLYFKFQFTTGGGNNIYFDDINIGSPVGIDNKESNSIDFQVYPNPVKNEINVEIANVHPGKVTISMMDIFGKILLRSVETLSTGNNNFNYGIENLNLKSGIYFINIEDDHQTYRSKINIIR